MNVCFLARPSFDRYSVELFEQLKKHDANVDAYFVTTNKKESDYVKAKVESAKTFETATFIRENWDNFNVDMLAEYEKKYDCAPVWKYIYADRYLITRDHDYVVKITVGLFSFFENLFSNNKIDFYYSEVIATLQCYVAYIVGKKHGVTYISQMTARGNLDSTYHYFTCDEFEHDINLEKDYLNVNYSPEEMVFADKFLTDFESNYNAPQNMSFVTTKPKLKFSYLKLVAARIIKRFDKNLNDPCSYMYYKEYKTYTDPIKFYFNYRKVRKCYKKPDYNAKYVYFPLHYQPEASTIVCAQKYEKQLFFIDSWAKSLPADTLLYVKEHYALIGHRDPQFYEELKKYPNVVLIDPWSPSKKLIEHSVAVTTLTGTAGWEAMLLRKPVFLGGNIVFDTAPGIIKVNEIFDNYLPLLSKWQKPEREDLLKYLCACFRSYKKGNVYAQNVHSLIDDNIQAIGQSLYEQLKIIINNKGDKNE